MNLKRFVLLFFVVFCAGFAFAEKDGYYGNIKLRSIGVGNVPQTERVHRMTLQNNANSSYMHYYGQRTDDQYNVQMSHNYTALRVNSGMSKESRPFEGDVVTTGSAMYAFPEPPKDPGAMPIGDALPFVVLMALGYVYVRSRK